MSACPHDSRDPDGLTRDSVQNQRQEAQENKREELLDKLADLIGQVKDDADLEQIERYLNELDPDPEPFNAQASLASFRERHNTVSAPSLERPSKKSRPVLLRRTARIAIIAVLCVAFVAAAHAGGLGILDILAKWTGSEFHFQWETSHQEIEDPLSTLQYSSLQDALVTYGVDLPLVPHIYPSGAKLRDIEMQSESGKMIFYASYEIPSGSLFITVRAIEDSPFSNVETNEQEIENYEAGGIEHHIIEDVTSLKAEWHNQDWEARISGNITYEELIAMIDSIYE